MKISIKKSLKIFLPIIFGLFLIWYSYDLTTPEDRAQIIRYIKEADLFWVSLSIILGVLSHVSRAIRWNYLLKPLGYQPKIFTNFLLILIAYFTNLGIPRSGEVLRATALTTYEGVPFEKGFGTIVTERVIDLIMLLLIITITLFLQTDLILGLLQDKGLDTTKILIALGIGLVGMVFFFTVIKKSKHAFALKIKAFINGLLEGVFSIFKMKRKWAFILHTLFIWTAYIVMFWVIKFTVLETIDLTVGQILVAFIAGAFAMSATNGGLGLFPIAVSKSLAIFGISSVSGDAYGWIMWISQTLMVVIVGAISFLVLPLWKRKQ